MSLEKAKKMTVTEGAPSANPEEPRRSPKFENGERKLRNRSKVVKVHRKSIRDEKHEITGNNICFFFCENVKHK